MADEGLENRHHGAGRAVLQRVVCVLRWMWIGVLSVLLLASIVCHAPWKVIGLIGVFLLACTALPRRRRKYFWTAVGLTMFALTLWVFLPDNSKGWRPYVFEKETEAFLAKYRVPPEQNAALLYENLCRRWEAEDPNEPNVPDDWREKTRKGPWRSDMHPEIAAWLDYHKTMIARLMEATAFDECFFDSDVRRWLLFPASDPPRLAPMRQLAFLLEAAANRDWAARGLAAAMERQLASLRFGVHLSQQPLELHVLTGQGIESLALQQLNRAIVDDDANSAHLERVADAVGRIKDDWRHTFAGVLQRDKLYTKNLFAAGTHQVNDAGQVRHSRDPLAFLRDQVQKALEDDETLDERTRREFRRVVYPGYWQRRAGKVWAILSWFLFPSSPEKMGKMFDRAYERYTPMLDPEFARPGEPRSSLSVIEGSDWRHFGRDFAYLADFVATANEEVYHGFRSSFRRAETARRGTRVLVALRRYKNAHGSWPQDLEAAQAYGKDTPFVDACGRPFVYRLQGEAFTLYSTGENGLDEKGQHKVEYSNDYSTATTVADDWMIYPNR